MNSNISEGTYFELNAFAKSLSQSDNESLFYGCTIVSGEPILTSIAAIVDDRADDEVMPHSKAIDYKEELQRFYKALEVSRNSLYLLTLKLQSAKDQVASDIVMTQHALIQDPWFQSIILEGIVVEGKSVEQSIHQAMEQLRQVFYKDSSGSVSEKYEDIEDVLKRLLLALKEGKKKKYDIMFKGDLAQVEKSPSGAIIAFSVSPSFASELSSYSIRGLVTCSGGVMSHTAVIMKSLGVPYISGISPDILLQGQKADSILLVPIEGMVILNPTLDRINKYFVKKQPGKNNYLETKKPFAKKKKQHTAIEIQATVHNKKEVLEAIDARIDSIGLFRTEYLAFYKGYIPSYEEQVEEYDAIFTAASGRMITFRTFDFSSDKDFFIPQYFHREFISEVLFRKPIYSSLLRDQIKAIISSSFGRPFRILFPMVTSKEEAAFCMRIYNEVWAMHQSCSFRPQVGVMVEVPRIGISRFLSDKKPDFISLGTNDLLQYSLAIDRNCTFATIEDARFVFAHMGFIHILYHIIQRLLKDKLPLSICGEMAGDPLFLPMLLGFGVRRISIAPKNIEKIRNAIHRCDANNTKLLVNKILTIPSSSEMIHIFKELEHLS